MYLTFHYGLSLDTGHRTPDTWIISISQACSYDFNRIYPKEYGEFKQIKLIHSSELSENPYCKQFNYLW